MTKEITSRIISFVVSAVLLSIHVEAAPNQCSDVSSLLLPDVRITAALTVADSASLTGRIKVPHCEVSGVIGTEIRFELLLPDDWNNRFFMGGGGGYVGSVQNSAIRTVNLGYATIGTDTGRRKWPKPLSEPTTGPDPSTRISRDVHAVADRP
jgi:feruloyl esterase